MGKFKQIDCMIREHFENLKDFYKVKDEDIANGEDKDAWKVVHRMESYLTALEDVGIIPHEVAATYYWEFFNWADYAWAEDEEEE